MTKTHIFFKIIKIAIFKFKNITKKLAIKSINEPLKFNVITFYIKDIAPHFGLKEDPLQLAK